MRKILFFPFCLLGLFVGLYPSPVYSSSFRIWGLTGVDKTNFKYSYQRESLFATGIQEDKVDEAIKRVNDFNNSSKFKENLDSTLKNVFTDVEARSLPKALNSKVIRNIMKAEARVHSKDFMKHFQTFMNTMTVLSYPKDRVEIVQKILSNNKALVGVLEYYSKMRIYSIYAVNRTERDFNRIDFNMIVEKRDKTYKKLKVPAEKIDEVLLKALMIYQNFFPEELVQYNKFLQTNLRKKYDNGVYSFFNNLSGTYFKALDDELKAYAKFVDNRYEEEYLISRKKVAKLKELQLKNREIEAQQQEYLQEVNSKARKQRQSITEAKEKAKEDALKEEKAKKEADFQKKFQEEVKRVQAEQASKASTAAPAATTTTTEPSSQ